MTSAYPGDLRDRYLGLLRDSLVGLIHEDPELAQVPGEARSVGFDRARRIEGRDWPSTAMSMIGAKRMLQLQRAAQFVIERGIPGDFVETGVWRGGACILMRGVLAAYGVTDRKVWVADSFAGLPPPDPLSYPHDAGMTWHRFRQLAVSLESVRSNFERYGLLDGQVAFLKGWFRDTLPNAPIERLAILRLDGDLYESTMQALAALYPKLSPGGFAIVDDYGVIPSCSAAVTDFRRERGIVAPIYRIDESGVYWQRDGD
jgi:O-methyltransferase